MKRNIKTARGKDPFWMFFVSVKKKIRLLSIYWKRKFSFAHFFSSLVNRKNAKRYAFVAGLFFLVIASATSLFFYQQFRTPESSSSPEVGFSSLSPSGSLGGEILPASCESNPGHCIQSSCDKNGCYCTAYEVVNCCVPNQGQTCSSSLNSCGQTQSNGSIQCNGSCSSTPPANPPGYGNACTGATSSPNACGQTSPGGAGSIQCNGSCSGATGSTPANPPWLGVGCSSAANACGQTNSGTYNCAGTCSASTPPNSACPAPPLAFSANPVTIVSGNSSTLTWTPTNAASCWAWGGGIDGWKTPTGGNQVVSPATTTTYFMECWNSTSVSSGVKQAAVNVTVPIPTVDLKINGSNGPLNLTQGATKNISWTTANAASCTASSSDGFSGSKSVPTGEESVIANVTSNHTLTCLNSLGNGNSDSVQVNVSCSQSCGSWSNCSVACGGGTQTRSCTNTSCLPYIDTQDCNTSACGDYNWKEVAP